MPPLDVCFCHFCFLSRALIYVDDLFGVLQLLLAYDNRRDVIIVHFELSSIGDYIPITALEGHTIIFNKHFDSQTFLNNYFDWSLSTRLVWTSSVCAMQTHFFLQGFHVNVGKVVFFVFVLFY